MRDKTHFIKSVSNKLFKTDSRRPKLTEKDLKARESEIGSKIFGPLQPNERREFFNDNERSWFFHQELTDQNGKVHSVTLHYEVHPKGILRVSSQSHVKNEFISGQELENFSSAIEIYYQRVMKQIYNRDVLTGKKLQ
ncbi:MAG: hypothetical protein WCH58_00520 [Candidatus Saccharibacteria bacterium]